MTIPSESISNAQARRIILSAQGLTKSNPFGAGLNAVIKAVNQLGYVQLDTISVVERAHHHILWSRIPGYEADQLEKAQYNKRKIFEYWSHAAAYLPMQEYRFSIPVMNAFRNKEDRWPATSKADMKKVLKRIREEGPLMSRHFESDHKSGNWWDWKPAKRALQRLFLEGELMVSHREGFQRVYDLPENIIPSEIDTSTPTLSEYYSHLIKTTLRAQGIAAPKEIFHLRKSDTKIFTSVFHQLQEENIIVPVKVDGQKNYFTLPKYLNQNIRLPEKMMFLSPFDNLIIWRKRLKDIFGFDYTLECYIPSGKRTYGYFCLPVLYKDQFIGRIDLKAERKNKSLQIKNEFWNEFDQPLKTNPLYEEALLSYSEFNKCTHII
ncbi:MAG TPA: crosslink repair DNA glycosylase YcaQ family protein [Saprospiraceae bacterium]|nr:crosslink repair DNA glycosylase YcaQ family protein [Saprospiraceae bacterium]